MAHSGDVGTALICVIEDEHVIANAVAARLRNEGFDVETAADGYTTADPERLHQVVANLLDNAVRHSPPEGRVWLSAHAATDGRRLPDGGRDSEMSEERERSFTQQAAAFEDPRLNRLFTTDSEWLFDRLPLRADDLVLDVAAGTGHVARRLAPQVRAVVAVDATRAMLEQGRAQAPPNVLFVHADAAALPFLDDSFDVVVTRFAVHHFEDPAVQLAEMRRVLRPTGRLAVADLIAHPEAAEAQNRLETLRDPSHARMLELDELARLVGTDDVEVRDVHRPLEPWLAQTDPAPDTANEIRAALHQELDGGPPTGFRPSMDDGELHFVHTMASLIARGTS